MLRLSALVFCFFAFTAPAPASADPSEDCVVTDFSQLENAIANCLEIVIRNLTVPENTTIDFSLQDGAILTFEGTTTFGHYQGPDWGYTLMLFQGDNITVQGAEGSLLDGQGQLYWDGIGDKGDPKPFFMYIRVTNSIFKNINLLNCPHHCIEIADSDGITITNWDIDCSYGDGHGGHNTDGFDITASHNVVIKDSSVVNQDDCVAVNMGSNMLFSGLHCNGSHGISISAGFSELYANNTVKNITYSNCTLVNSINAIHIKTHMDGGEGEITDVTYENIRFSDIINFAINIQQDYADGGSTGNVKGNIPITNLVFKDIHGELSSTSKNATPVYIFCAENACVDWHWTDVSVTGGVIDSWCNYTPDGYTC